MIATLELAPHEKVLVPVLSTKTLRGWPKHERGGVVSYLPMATALLKTFDTDCQAASLRETGEIYKSWWCDPRPTRCQRKRSNASGVSFSDA